MSRSALFDQELALRGRDVLLRPLSAGDAADIAAAAEGLKASHPYSFVPGGIDEARIYIETALREKTKRERYPFAIIFRDVVVGTTSYLDFVWWPRAGADDNL